MTSLILLTVGLFLLVMGVRFMMVKNSLKAGKPSDKRLKTLKREAYYLLAAGFILFLIGFLSPYFGIPVEQTKSIANVGGVLFGLGIPQFLQWKKGQGNQEEINKSMRTIRNWAWGMAIFGAVLTIGSPFIPV